MFQPSYLSTVTITFCEEQISICGRLTNVLTDERMTGEMQTQCGSANVLRHFELKWAFYVFNNS
jgi:hypothetical protein